MNYYFLSFTLDTQRMVLEESGISKKLDLQVLSVLEVLVANSDRIVTRQEILDHVWDGRIVAPNNIDSRIRSARVAIGDTGRQQKYIKTYTNRGFRFVPDVTIIENLEALENLSQPKLRLKYWRQLASVIIVVTAAAVASTLILRKNANEPFPTELVLDSQATLPSMVLLPFEDISGTTLSKETASNLTFEMRGNFSRMKGVRIISSSVLLNTQSEAQSARDIYEEFDIQYLFKGTVRDVGGVFETFGELTNVQTGEVILTQRYDGTARDDNQLQNLVELSHIFTSQVANGIGISGGIPIKPQTTPEAYELYLHAINLGDDESAESLLQTIKELESVIELDPNYVPAYADLAFFYIRANYLTSVPDAMKNAKSYLKQGMVLDPNNLDILIAAAEIAYAESRPNDALSFYEKGLEFAPNSAALLFGRASILSELRRYEEAIEAYEEALILDPTPSHVMLNLANLKLNVGDIDGAMQVARRNMRLNNNGPVASSSLGLLFLLQGEYVDAYDFIQQVLLKNPDDSYVQFDLLRLYLALGLTDEAPSRFTYPAWGAIMETLSGDRTAATEVLKSDADTYDKTFVGYYAHDYVSIYEIVKQTAEYSGYFKTSQSFGLTDPKLAAIYAFILRENNEPSAALIVKNLEAYFKGKTAMDLKIPDEFFAAAALNALNEDYDAAYKWIEEGVNRGYVFLNLNHEPLFAELISRPEYIDLEAKMKSRADTVRASFRDHK